MSGIENGNNYENIIAAAEGGDLEGQINLADTLSTPADEIPNISEGENSLRNTTLTESFNSIKNNKEGNLNIIGNSVKERNDLVLGIKHNVEDKKNYLAYVQGIKFEDIAILPDNILENMSMENIMEYTKAMNFFKQRGIPITNYENLGANVNLYNNEIFGESQKPINYVEKYNAGINTHFESKQDYQERYGEFVTKLENELGLPNGITDAIIGVESNYGKGLNSRTGAKGMMQLTKWPFKELRGEYSGGRLDPNKSLGYKQIFESINIAEFKNLRGIGETLPENIWSQLEKISNPATSIEEYQNIMNEFRSTIKGRNTSEYYHTLNIIIGSVYYKTLVNKSNGNLEQAAINYNGDDKIGPGDGGRPHKYRYGRKVMGKYSQNIA